MEKSRFLLLAFFAVLIIAGIGIIIYGLLPNAKTPAEVNNSLAVSEEGDTETIEQKPTATIEMKDFGTIKLELEPGIAPQTVANFISLANSGFYDGLIFHRTKPEFMIQGGDKAGTGSRRK